MFISFPNNGRLSKNLITALLKSQVCGEIKRLNYVKSYKLNDGKITKQEEKILRISDIGIQKEKLEKILQKFPDAIIIQ